MGKRLHFMTGLIAPLQVKLGSEVRVYEELLATERMPAVAGDLLPARRPSGRPYRHGAGSQPGRSSPWSSMATSVPA